MKPRYRILTSQTIRAGDWVLLTEGCYEVMRVIDTVSSIIFEYKLMNWEKGIERRLLGNRDLRDWHPLLKVRQV